MWSDSTSRWCIPNLDIVLTWTLTRKKLQCSIVDAKSSIKVTQDDTDRAFVSWHCDKFKTDNALMYHILSKIFIDRWIWIHKERKSNQDGVFFNINKQFLALAMCSGRSQKQRERCKPHTMVKKAKRLWQVFCTPQEIALNNGEPCQFWPQWNQW